MPITFENDPSLDNRSADERRSMDEEFEIAFLMQDVRVALNEQTLCYEVF